MSGVVAFSREVVRWWGSLATGGVAIALLAAYERWFGAVSGSTYFAVMVLAIYAAAYRAWSAERERASAAEAAIMAGRPQVIILCEIGPKAPTEQPVTLRNTSGVTAYNVQVAPLSIGGATARFPIVAHIPAGGHAHVHGENSEAAPIFRHNLAMFLDLLPANSDDPFGDVTTEVVATYTDFAGSTFRTKSVVTYNRATKTARTRGVSGGPRDA